MSSMFDSTLWAGAATLLDGTFAAGGYTLTRGAAESLEFAASHTGQAASQYAENGLPANAEERTWYVPRAIVLDGLTIVPRPGDVIATPEGERWQVLPNGKRPSVAAEDADRWRVEAKKIG